MRSGDQTAGTLTDHVVRGSYPVAGFGMLHKRIEWGRDLGWFEPFLIGRGYTEQITIRPGGFPWPLHVWTEAGAEVDVEPLEERRDTLKLTVSEGLSAGPYWCRVYASQYIGPWFLLVVEEHPILLDQSSTNRVQVRQLPAPPVTVAGLLSRTNRTDRWTLLLPRPARLRVEAGARAYGIPLPLNVAVEESSGSVLASSPASTGSDPEPIYVRVPAGALTLVVEVAAEPGSDEDPLRTYGTLPYRLFVETQWLDPSSVEGRLAQLGPAELGSIRLGSFASWIEPPAVIHGVIGGPGDRDRYRLSLRSGQQISVSLLAGSIDSSLEPELSIEDASGLVLLHRAGPDVMVDWIAPESGDYFIVIQDVAFRGGPNYRYRLELAEPTGAVQVWIESEPIRVVRGETFEVPVRIDRPDRDRQPLTISMLEGPDAIQVEPLLVGATQGTAVLTGRVTESVNPGVYRIRLGALLLRQNGQVESVPVRVAVQAEGIEPSGLIKAPPEWVWIQVLP